MKVSAFWAFVLVIQQRCMAVVGGDPDGSDEVPEDTCALLQGSSFGHHGHLRPECTRVNECKSDCCVLVITTPGAEYPCCGCPKPHAPDCGCGLLRGTDMQDMAAAFAKGVRNTSDCQVEVADISKKGGCPDFNLVKGFDAIILAAPSYNNGVAPDMKTFWHRFDKHGMDGLSCKVGAAITRNGAYYTGAQPTLEELHRMMLQRQMIIASGPNWNTGEGVAEMIGQWPFFAETAPDFTFTIDAEAVGARIGNLTKAMKTLPQWCGSNIFGTNLTPADPYYALMQTTARKAQLAKVEERPVPPGAPEWPGWSGQQGNRDPPYVSLYKSNFSWVDPTCGNAPVTSKVIIITTAGANGYKAKPCCGCPEPQDGKRCGCFKHTGDRTLQMAQAVRFGFHSATGGCANSGIRVDIYDITENTTGTAEGCPSWDFVKGYDLFIFGSPTWNGLPTSDIISYTNLWPLSETDLRCKPAAGFSTGGGYQAGAQMVVESLKRIAMTFQMFWVGGPQWNIGEAAMANTGDWPFEKQVGSDKSVAPLFLNDAWGLGARLANLTGSGQLKQLTALCGIYPAQEDVDRR